MRRLAYIIPGFTESVTTNPAYSHIATLFQEKGIEPIILNIPWKQHVMSDYLTYALANIQSSSDQEIYLLGFSYGAFLSFLLSSTIRPKSLILCSLSPYFQEDIPYLKGWWKRVTGKKRMADFATISFDTYVSRITAKTIILAGDREGSEVLRRVNDAHLKIADSELIILPGTKHDINTQTYLHAIKGIITKI